MPIIREMRGAMGIVRMNLMGWACLLVLAAMPAANAAWAAAKPPRSALVRQLSALAGPRDAVLVSAPDGRTLAAIHKARPLVPASILKLLTTLTALDKLGPGYRFRTDFYLDSRKNLKIKGYGDPLLTSEALKAIARHLATLIPTVHNLVLDDSFFAQPVRIPGRGRSTEPYDAPNGALCVNFNTVAFARHNGRWISDEPQTPLLPSVIPLIEASGLSSGRITLAASRKEALAYTGAMFRYFLEQNGITVQGAVLPGRIAAQQDRMIWRYRSEIDLSGAISKLLEYSNNFIANQILLVMGAEAQGPPASMDKGLAVLRAYYRDTLGLHNGRIVEASGISRQDRISAQAMMTVLKRFSPYHKLMRKQGRQYYKTGHLKGVRSRAGYIASRDGKLYRFVVMVNTPGKNTRRIMRVLERGLQ